MEVSLLVVDIHLVNIFIMIAKKENLAQNVMKVNYY